MRWSIPSIEPPYYLSFSSRNWRICTLNVDQQNSLSFFNLGSRYSFRSSSTRCRLILSKAFSVGPEKLSSSTYFVRVVRSCSYQLFPVIHSNSPSDSLNIFCCYSMFRSSRSMMACELTMLRLAVCIIFLRFLWIICSPLEIPLPSMNIARKSLD